jgi:hypothetical protein
MMSIRDHIHCTLNNDEAWEKAIDALRPTTKKRSNARPLAKLLRSGQPVQPQYAKSLADLIDPDIRHRVRYGFEIKKFRDPGRPYAGAKDKMEIYKLMKAEWTAQLVRDPNKPQDLDAVVAAISRPGLRRSTLMKIWSAGWAIDEFNRWLGELEAHMKDPSFRAKLEARWEAARAKMVKSKL